MIDDESSRLVIDEDVYHSRRKQTHYLVGSRDLEDSLAEEITSNTHAVRMIQN